ncbi:unnamed protein product [Blepharisma stoltei]|uniref:Uncharacterized protein n=1 Tax=Blepharisma stoltei TaxID=1481888 RepID=A0AAU9IHN1_9CILI|nr:unnamed protein product [Blepharisma stoltei]
MRLSHIFDKKVDQNEIESKYLWNLHNNAITKIIHRINLITFKIDYSLVFTEYDSILSCTAIPNNQIYGMKVKKFSKYHQYLYLSDENFNIKEIETPIKHPSIRHYFVSCFYDDSIFIFESEYNFGLGDNKVHKASRFLISKNQWVHLTNFPFDFLTSCTGLNQKIIISTDQPGLWIYDICLDSYTHHLPIADINVTVEHKFIKFSGRLYMIMLSQVSKVYSCEDPLSEWKFECDFKDQIFGQEIFPHVFYEGSIYYLRGATLYEFSLSKFESKEVKT